MKADRLSLYWSLALLWSAYCSWQILTTGGAYYFGPLLVVGIWLLPMLPLLAVTWRRRLWSRGAAWRWLPAGLLAAAFALAAAPLPVPRVHFDGQRQWTTVQPITRIVAFSLVGLPLVFSSVLLCAALRSRPRAG
jgi:hypothetical protein